MVVIGLRYVAVIWSTCKDPRNDNHVDGRPKEDVLMMTMLMLMATKGTINAVVWC